MTSSLLINLLSLRQSRAGGAETYAVELVPRILEGWTGTAEVLVRSDAREWLVGLGWPSAALVPVNSRGSGSASVISAAIAARRSSVGRDVVFSPFNIHTSGAARAGELVGVHDLLSFHYLAGTWGRLGPRQGAVLKAKSVGLRDAIAKAGAVVVHSEAMRGDVLRFVPKVDPTRIHLVHLGADRGAGPKGGGAPDPGTDLPPGRDASHRETSGLAAGADEPFVLLVGSSTWRHKNLDLAFEMANTATFAATGARLVIVGRDVPEVPTGLTDRVVALRDIADAELASLYERCSCLLFPSQSEGFGLPLVEAMHNGVPCLVSDIDVFRELAGDAARYFDPTAPGSAARAVADVLANEDTANAMRAAGRERSDRFTWDGCAEGYLAVLRALPQP